jgi:hypothetical protein
MSKKKHEEQAFQCPVGRFFADLQLPSGEKSNFFKHLDRSRMEFLKAVRSLVDDRIEAIEKREKKTKKKKATRIKVE